MVLAVVVTVTAGEFAASSPVLQERRAGLQIVRQKR